MDSLKRGFAGLMAGMSAIGCVVPAFASNIWDESYTHNTQEGSDSNVDVNVLVQNRTVPVIFSAYVPATVKIAVSRDKQIITPENLRIINGVDTLPIGVWDVKTKPVNNWTILDWDTNFKDKQMTDQKKFAMTMNGNDLSVPVSKLPWEIQPAGELPLTLDAKIPYQSAAKDMEEIMTVSFTMDWMDRVAPPNFYPHATGTVMSTAKLNKLAEKLTGTVSISKEKHNPSLHGKGADVSLAGDGSVICVVKGQDATVYGDGGVKCQSGLQALDHYGPGGDTVFGVFENYQAKTLDVSGLDTSEVTNFHAMFCYTAATTIKGLNRLDTSKGTDMYHMFWNSKAETLDLSNFDMSNVVETTGMFQSTIATRVYCRTKNDLDKMIHSSGRAPSASAFIVGKPQ